MTTLLVATRNSHKTREMRQILGNAFKLEDLSAHPKIPVPIESGETFEDNATIKAVGVSRHVDGLVVGDDSGLEVDVLDGRPGVFSARYAGEGATDQQNVMKLLGELKGRNSPARFRCVVALARNGKLLGTFPGTVEGAMIDAPRGADGFGYDPIFVPSGFDQTFAELSAEIKNRISHRAMAAAALRGYLEQAA
jgi:XTP/dITP diphosphohydrolase